MRVATEGRFSRVVDGRRVADEDALTCARFTPHATGAWAATPNQMRVLRAVHEFDAASPRVAWLRKVSDPEYGT